jgi:hypothetical protein
MLPQTLQSSPAGLNDQYFFLFPEMLGFEGERVDRENTELPLESYLKQLDIGGVEKISNSCSPFC